MQKILVHIEPREISYEGTSVASEHILPALDAYTTYNEKSAEVRIINPEALDNMGSHIPTYNNLGNSPYNAFYFTANDYILVSKWQNGIKLSEVKTKFIFEIVNNCDYGIQVRNPSNDKIVISYRFYKNDVVADLTKSALMTGSVGTNPTTLILNNLTNTDNLQIQNASQPIVFSTLKTMRVVNYSVNNTVAVNFNNSVIIIPAAQVDSPDFVQFSLPDLDVTAQTMQIYTAGPDTYAPVDIFLLGE